MNRNVFASNEQLRYADVLFYGCWVGLAVMLLTYFAYVAGLVPPHVPLDELPQYWSQPVAHYLEQTRVPTGWGWVKLLNYGDFLNFIGVVILAGLSIVCYLRTIPALFRKKDTIMGVIAVLEVLVLLVAASGIAGSGGH